MKSRSRSVTVGSSGQGAWSFIIQEVLVFVRRSSTHRLNIVDVDNDANAIDDARKWSLCHSCLLKQSRQESKNDMKKSESK